MLRSGSSRTRLDMVLAEQQGEWRVSRRDVRSDSLALAMEPDRSVPLRWHWQRVYRVWSTDSLRSPIGHGQRNECD